MSTPKPPQIDRNLLDKQKTTLIQPVYSEAEEAREILDEIQAVLRKRKYALVVNVPDVMMILARVIEDHRAVPVALVKQITPSHYDWKPPRTQVKPQ